MEDVTNRSFEGSWRYGMSRTRHLGQGVLRNLTYRAPSGHLRPSAAMDEFAYYEMRMRQEKEAARAAASPNARECHEELVSAYDLRCRILRKEMRSDQELRVQKALESQDF